MTDVLAPFRRPGAAPAAPPEAEPVAQPEPSGYRAFGVAGGTVRPLRLELRAANGLAVARPYGAISEIIYDRNSYAGIKLKFPQLMVVITGKNLRPVVEALLAGTCEHIAQIRPEERAQPDAPIVESITSGPIPAAAPAAAAKPTNSAAGAKA